MCFLNFFSTRNPLGVYTQGFVGASYPGALGQRVIHFFGIRTCDPCDSFLTILTNQPLRRTKAWSGNQADVLQSQNLPPRVG